MPPATGAYAFPRHIDRNLHGIYRGWTAVQARALVSHLDSRLPPSSLQIISFLSMDLSCRAYVVRAFCVAAANSMRTVLLADITLISKGVIAAGPWLLPDAAIAGLYHGRFEVHPEELAGLGQSLVRLARERAEIDIGIIVIDLGPRDIEIAARVNSSASGGTVLIVKGGIDKRRIWRDTASTIQAAGGAVLGAVFIEPSSPSRP